MNLWKRKYLLTGVMAVAAALTLEGCVSPAQKKEKAARALQEKYQERFEITAFRDSGIFNDYYTVKAYSVEHPDLLFEASVNNEGDGISDAYVTKRVCERLSEQVSRNLGELQNDYYVFTQAMLEGTVLTDPEVSMQDYLADGPNKFTIYLCMDENGADVKNITTAMLNMMKDISGIRGSVAIYLADSETLAWIEEYVISHDDTEEDFFERTDPAYIGSIQFEDGKLPVSEVELKEMVGDRL